MTATLLAIGAGLLLGFAAGVCVGRARRGVLAEVADWLGEEVEAVHGADLDADVAAERALRMPQRQETVELYDQDAEPEVRHWRCDTEALTLDDGSLWCPTCTEFLSNPADHLGQPCGWSEDGTTTCGEPAEGWARWPDGEPTWFCATHMAWMRESVEDGSGGTLPRSLPGRLD